MGKKIHPSGIHMPPKGREVKNGRKPHVSKSGKISICEPPVNEPPGQYVGQLWQGDPAYKVPQRR